MGARRGPRDGDRLPGWSRSVAHQHAKEDEHGTRGEGPPPDPEQPGEGGYGEGVEHEPHTPEDDRVGSFADGEETIPHDHKRKGRFSEGEEELPDTPEK